MKLSLKKSNDFIRGSLFSFDKYNINITIKIWCSYKRGIDNCDVRLHTSFDELT